MKTNLAVYFLLFLAAVSLLCARPGRINAQEGGNAAARGPLNTAFHQAAEEFGVPRDLLAAVAYAETHFDPHGGGPSIANGYGLMHLIDNPRVQTLPLAARLLGVPEEVLKGDTAQNIRGGAAVLRFYADEQKLDADARKDLAAWYRVVARYSNATDSVVSRLYADDVYNLLNRGLSGTSPEGETVIVVAQEVELRRGEYEAAAPEHSPDYRPAYRPRDEIELLSLDYGPALWVPARFDHYRVANRPSSHAITHVIIHTTEGTYASAISWFRDPSNPFKTSAHYVIRSSDGEITQMVREKDIAHHIGGWNSFTVGIEHEAFVSNPAWYTDVMYRRSAELTRTLCLRYGIPMDRQRIVGHVEVPGATHTDPGPYWNWNYYMQLVTQSSGWSMIVGNTTAGRFTASSNWGTSAWSEQRYGTDYRYATPAPVSDAAWYKFPIPENGRYEVYVWYPAHAGYNSSTPVAIETAGGTQFVRVNQQVSGGQWVSLGTHTLNGGDYNAVGISRWTSASGYVIADAVRVVRR